MSLSLRRYLDANLWVDLFSDIAQIIFQKSIENKGISQESNGVLTYNILFQSLEFEQYESDYNLELKFCNLISHFVGTGPNC